MRHRQHFARAAVLIATLTPLPNCLAEVRSFDGTGNNLTHFGWGASGTNFPRSSPAAYLDGMGEQLVQTPNPRDISNQLSAQIESLPNTRQLSGMVWQWGQFLDHDMTLSLNGSHYGTAPIMAPQPDPDGMTLIPFNRTQFDPATGSSLGSPREQVNSISSYIDASNVYGSDDARAAALRSFVGGRLKISGAGLGLLPTNAQDAALAAVPNDDGGLGAPELFVAGDVRANEQPGLTALHTIFVREHNRLAGELTALHQGDAAWDDERIYQTARRIVGAEVQAVTYNEFLPAVLGSYAPSTHAPLGYQPAVDASVTNEFATAFYRFGHSMIGKELLVMDDDGNLIDAMELRDVFFRPDVIMDAAHPDGILDDLLMGLTKQMAEQVDARIVDEVRSFLFAPNMSIGLDLAAINIQRGRDHGIPNYNVMREALGLTAANDFADVTSDVSVQDTLASLYGDVAKMDSWVGALVEDHVPGAGLGPLIMASLLDQFERLRDGDRFFYTHDDALKSSDITDVIDLDGISLSQIIMRNTQLTGLASNAFLVPEPASLFLLVMGLALAGQLTRTRR